MLERDRRGQAQSPETLGIMNVRLALVERAAAVATQGRSLLDQRVDRLEARVEAIERER